MSGHWRVSVFMVFLISHDLYQGKSSYMHTLLTILTILPYRSMISIISDQKQLGILGCPIATLGRSTRHRGGQIARCAQVPTAYSSSRQGFARRLRPGANLGLAVSLVCLDDMRCLGFSWLLWKLNGLWRMPTHAYHKYIPYLPYLHMGP